MKERILVRFRNASHFHERLMAWYLKKCGWVVFYLDKEARTCGQDHSGCWMDLYNQGEK